jgi:hypothetical protein
VVVAVLDPSPARSVTVVVPAGSVAVVVVLPSGPVVVTELLPSGELVKTRLPSEFVDTVLPSAALLPVTTTWPSGSVVVAVPDPSGPWVVTLLVPSGSVVVTVLVPSGELVVTRLPSGLDTIVLPSAALLPVTMTLPSGSVVVAVLDPSDAPFVTVVFPSGPVLVCDEVRLPSGATVTVWLPSGLESTVVPSAEWVEVEMTSPSGPVVVEVPDPSDARLRTVVLPLPSVELSTVDPLPTRSTVVPVPSEEWVEVATTSPLGLVVVELPEPSAARLTTVVLPSPSVVTVLVLPSA